MGKSLCVCTLYLSKIYKNNYYEITNIREYFSPGSFVSNLQVNKFQKNDMTGKTTI